MSLTDEDRQPPQMNTAWQRIAGIVFPAALALTLAGCDEIRANSDYDVHTLYRSSWAGSEQERKEARIHVATFDSSDGEKYNRENCGIAKELFQNQPGVTVQYWCETGRAKRGR